MRILFATTVALSVVLATAGVAYATPSKAEFIRKGDALCAQTQRALVPIQQRAQAAKSLPQEQQWTAVGNIWADQIAIQRRFITKLSGIGTPAGDQVAGSLVAKMRQGLALAVNVQHGFAHRDTTRLPAVLSNYVTFSLNLNRRVAAYGFRTCGR